MKKQSGASGRKQPGKTNDQIGKPVNRRFGRRSVMLALGGVAAAAAGATRAVEIVVYKSPSCECCGEWAKHLRSNGFDVLVNNVEDTEPFRKQAGIPDGMESCHTAFIDGYAVEGHVPAKNIHRILADRPKIRGLAVPGMPASAPGMDGPDPEPYTVYSFDGDGKSEVYASY